MTDADKAAVGCTGEKARIPYLLDGEQLWTCPKRAYCENTRDLDPILERWVYASRGQFPEPGQWTDQPAQLIDCFRTIDAALSDAEGVLAKRREAAAKAARAQERAPKAPQRAPHAHPSVRKQ